MNLRSCFLRNVSILLPCSKKQVCVCACCVRTSMSPRMCVPVQFHSVALLLWGHFLSIHLPPHVTVVFNVLPTKRFTPQLLSGVYEEQKILWRQRDIPGKPNQAQHKYLNVFEPGLIPTQVSGLCASVSRQVDLRRMRGSGSWRRQTHSLVRKILLDTFKTLSLMLLIVAAKKTTCDMRVTFDVAFDCLFDIQWSLEFPYLLTLLPSWMRFQQSSNQINKMLRGLTELSSSHNLLAFDL